MNQEVIDQIDLVLAKMTEVVEEVGPETKYADLYPDAKRSDDPNLIACQYLVKNKPACLVGRVLALVGWSNDELSRLCNMAVSELLYDPRLFSETWRVLHIAQRIQDTNQSWGAALRAAKVGAARIEAVYGS